LKNTGIVNDISGFVEGDNMKLIFRGLYFFVAVSIVLVVYDYSKNNTFDWFENLTDALLFVVFYMVFTWFFNSFKKKNENEKA